jgi:hypothetical protein
MCWRNASCDIGRLVSLCCCRGNDNGSKAVVDAYRSSAKAGSAPYIAMLPAPRQHISLSAHACTAIAPYQHLL